MMTQERFGDMDSVLHVRVEIHVFQRVNLFLAFLVFVVVVASESTTTIIIII